MKKFYLVLVAVMLVFSLAACEEGVGTAPTFDLDLSTLVLTEGEITEDLTLPSIAGGEIIWVSSDSTVLTGEGKVMRPSATRGPVTVVLTAIVLDGPLAGTKSFTFTVLPDDLTDAERVDAALDAIDIPDIVTGPVTLPTEVAGAMLVWESSNPAYLDEKGNVTRPHYDFSDEHVVLTAFVSAGRELKMFQQSVTVAKMAFAEHGSVGNPFTVSLTTQDDHVIYIPVENIDKPFNVHEVFPFIYTPEFGTHIPNNVSGWGLALEIAEDGTVRAVYDGISGVKRTAEGDLPWAGGGNWAKDPETCDLDENDNIIWSTCAGLPIPEDGYIFVFFNSLAGNTKNNREFARTYLNTMDLELTIEGLTLTPSTMQFEIKGGVWWRGNATVSVPLAFINPDIETFDYNDVLLLDENDMQIGGAPVIFTKSVMSHQSIPSIDVIDINNGWGIAAEMTPETRAIQVIGNEPDLIDYELTNQWRITRVYDGIGGSIKNPLPEGNVPVGGADYAKNIRLPEVGYVMVFPGTAYGYASDADVLNRRIGADYFYHLDNWVFDPVLVEAEGLQDVIRSTDWD